MKKRIKLSLTIICLCLSFLTLSYGVYAATSNSLSINNYVTFTSSDIYVSVNSFNVYQNNTYTTANANKVKTYNISQEIMPDDVKDWSSADEIQFTSEKPYLVFEFFITNQNLEYDATLTVTNISFPGTSNIEMVRQDGVTATVSNNTSDITFTISKNTTSSICFSAKLKNIVTSIAKANGQINFTLTFSKK